MPFELEQITYTFFLYQIRNVSVNIFVDLDAVSVAIDGGCYSSLVSDMVAC